MKNVGVFLLLALLSLGAIPAASQTRAAEKLSFEVASVKEHPFSPGFVGLDFQPEGRMVAMMAPLQMLITAAYDIVSSQLQTAPNLEDAALKTHYDIEAKAAPGMIPPGKMSREHEHKMALMLQDLLADRFKLKMHTEKKELPIYALLVEKGGLKLKKSPNRDCSLRPSPCRWTSRIGPSEGINGESVSLNELADALSFFDRDVVNKTGIEDLFDIHLPPYSRGAPMPGALVDGLPVDLNAPSIAMILHDVGLRREAQKAVMDVYIIDHVEKPSAN